MIHIISEMIKISLCNPHLPVNFYVNVNTGNVLLLECKKIPLGKPKNLWNQNNC